MGDMADFVLNDVLDDEEARSRYHSGNMSETSAFDRGIVDELGFEGENNKRRRLTTCKYCGQGGLLWKRTNNGRWRLLELNKVHTCRKYKKGNTNGST